MSVTTEKKTIDTRVGKLSVPKQHVLCRTPLGFKMSPYWQEQCVYIGQQEVFEQGSETLEKLTGQHVSAKQLERMCHAYGQLLSSHSSKTKESLVVDEDQSTYGMMDGAMVLTREGGWKELKLARLFNEGSLLPENENRNFIRESTYVAHLGGKDAFCSKVEKAIENLDNMIWIADGAKWIWNWLDDFYPHHHQILDFYHASEKLHDFAREAFKSKARRAEWVDHQLDLLLDNGVEIVMINVELVRCRGSAARQKQKTLLTYYENNLQRMQYKNYQDKGWLIGSGPIESAHRTVIQQRMKLSGQRWTINGAQQVANLRVAEKSGDWATVKNLICNPSQ